MLKTRVSIVAAACCIFPLTLWTGATEAAQDSKKPLEAAKIYRKNCATCHGNDGRAKTLKGKFKGATNLTDATWQASVKDESINDTITIGKNGGMPAFGKKLNKDEVTALVGYVRALKK